jgi:hypothetical protein
VKTSIISLYTQSRKTIVDKTNQTAGRCVAIRDDYGLSNSLQAAQQELDHMQASVKSIDARISELNNKLSAVEHSCQVVDQFQKQLAIKLEEARRIQKIAADKQHAAMDMLNRIRIALTTHDNVSFWHSKVRYCGGKAVGPLSLPDGINQIIAKIPMNVDPARSESILNEVRNISENMLMKARMSCWGWIKNSLFHVRDPHVTQLYHLLSQLHPDPRKNDLNMLNAIPGLIITVPRIHASVQEI